MKRIFSLIAAALFAVLSIVPAALADGGKVVFSMNSVENVSPGESFTVTLSISGEYEAHGMNLSIEFDPGAMTLESCDQGGYLDAIRAKNAVVVLDSETLAPEGKIRLGVMMPSDPATGSGDVLVMKFHVNEGVTVNQQVIMIIREFIHMPLHDANGNPNYSGTPIPFSTHNSIITLNGGATPEAGYNEGDDGVGNNNSSSPSQAPGGSSATNTPGTTPAHGASGTPGTRPTPAHGTTPNATSESRQSEISSTGKPAPADATEIPSGTDANAPGEPNGSNEQQSGENRKPSSLPYIIIAVGAAAVVAVSAVVISKKKKRG